MVQEIGKLYQWLKPRRWYSWQTLIWLGGFSGLMGLLAKIFGNTPWTNVVVGLISTSGWCFLIVGCSWAAREKGLAIAPWITAALICLFVAGNSSINSWKIILTIFPILAGIIFTLPYFWDNSFQLKLPSIGDRVTILLLLGSQMMISFWFQFYLLLADYSQQYPSLMSDDLSHSLFIIKSPTLYPPEPRGAAMLQEMELALVGKYNQKPWDQTSQDLTTHYKKMIQQLNQKINTDIIEEFKYWHISSQLTTEKQSYRLYLRYNWNGPKAKLYEPYFVEKTCEFKFFFPDRQTPEKGLTQVFCGDTKIHGWL